MQVDSLIYYFYYILSLLSKCQLREISTRICVCACVCVRVYVCRGCVCVRTYVGVAVR